MVKFFSDQGKTAKKLLSDDFVQDKKISAKTKTADGVTFEVSQVQSSKSGDVDGDLSIKSTVRDVELHTKLSTSGKLATEATLKKLPVDGLKLVLNAAYAPSATAGSGKVEYTRGRLAATAFADPFKKAVVATAAVGLEGLNVGAEAVYDVAGKALKGYTAAVSYTDGKEMEVTVATLDKLDTHKVTYSHSVRSDVVVAAEFLYKRSDAAKTLTLGAKYAVDKFTAVKAKINSTGSLSMAYVQALYPNTTLKLATALNVNQLESAAPKIGFQLAYEA